MKTLLHRLCSGMFLGMAIMGSTSLFAQIDYQEDFSGGHSWAGNSFETTNVATCAGNAAMRARISNILVAELPAVAVSPSIGISNGEEVELTYSYRLLNYDPVLPIIPVDLIDFGSITLEYATSNAGPWIDLDNISLPNYSGSADCSTRIVSFTPPEGSAVFLRFRANLGIALDLDYYVYLDEVNVTQQTLSLGENTISNKIMVYPNPVIDYLNLQYDGFINDVALFNMQGQQVAVWSMDTDFRRLDLSGLAAGTYVMKIAADDGIKSLNIIKD